MLASCRRAVQLMQCLRPVRPIATSFHGRRVWKREGPVASNAPGYGSLRVPARRQKREFASPCRLFTTISIQQDRAVPIAAPHKEAQIVRPYGDSETAIEWALTGITEGRCVPTNS